ncbi:MAG: M14 family zinc carboxypeptidase [Cytophagales bacterium]|nr:M14 family zinc carboxypeptidase [Bernardetiaceae bacterium]MDW8211099.1 M14 family zinc carboxypeptidase [Cytophagales bacterium]
MKRLLTLGGSLVFITALWAQAGYFYPNSGPMNAAIPTPEQFLGYPIGSYHTRYDRIVAYFETLARLSDKAQLEVLGNTYENRPLIALIVTSAANQSRLEEIRQRHLQRNTATAYDDEPIVIQIAANVHGNEASGGESALLTAYYLLANESEQVKNWLDNMVILIVPVQNPDGRDRFNTWVNMHKGTPPVADPFDREHTEAWPGGRMNHYWFDPNRDWFLLVHPETQALARFVHKWRPYVLVDHHEMGTNSTFYFDPGKPSSDNPLIPDRLYKSVYPKFSKYFEQAMNKLGSLYFTREVFDKLYPGYGSSYINFYGGAGFLFEQASSRGQVQETPTGQITFAFAIRNQFHAALATLQAAYSERKELLEMRREFFRVSREQAIKSPIKGYVFGQASDPTRTNAFVNLCLQHEIEVYELASNFSAGGYQFEKGSAYFVPTDQPNYVMVRSLFEKSIPYADSLFYDASAWSMIHAFNLPYAEIKSNFTKGEKVVAPKVANPPPVEKAPYGYVIRWTDYNAAQAVYRLLEGGAVVQAAFRPFSFNINGKNENFGYGTIFIPVQQQKITSDSLYQLLKKVQLQAKIVIYSLATGRSIEGIDLGSNYMRALRKPEALLVVGQGVSAYEAGEVWHLLDQRIGMPIAKVDVSNLSRVNLNRYNTIIMVNGTYTTIEKAVVERLKAWVQNGGTLIAQKSAAEWAIKNELTKEKLLPSDTTKRDKPLRYDYDNAVYIEGAKSIGGVILEMDLDITHPLGFGFQSRKVSVFRNGTTFFKPSENPYNTVGQYTASPLIGGYLSDQNLKKVQKSAAILASSEAAGRVILFADNPNFRGIWYGTNRLFFNALIFGNHINTPTVISQE